MKTGLISLLLSIAVLIMCAGCYVEDKTPGSTTIVNPPAKNVIVSPPANHTTIVNPPAEHRTEVEVKPPTTGGDESGSTTTTTTTGGQK